MMKAATDSVEVEKTPLLNSESREVSSTNGEEKQDEPTVKRDFQTIRVPRTQGVNPVSARYDTCCWNTTYYMYMYMQYSLYNYYGVPSVGQSLTPDLSARTSHSAYSVCCAYMYWISVGEFSKRHNCTFVFAGNSRFHFMISTVYIYMWFHRVEHDL